MMNKKGLINGLIALMAVIFFMAIISAIGTSIWTKTNDAFQNLPDSTATNETKEKIDSYGQIMYQGDYFIVYTFIALLIAYLITASVSNTSNPIFVLIFFGFLILVTFLAMMLSNAWTFMVSQEVITSLEHYSFTDFIMTYYPIINFFVGIIGIIIFYTRRGGTEGAGRLGGEF